MDDIQIEYESYMWWAQVYMTNKKGTKYAAAVSPINTNALLSLYNVTKGRLCTMKSAPKWVQKTIEEQIPIVAIMLS